MQDPIRFIHIPKTGGTTIINYLRDNRIDFLWGSPVPGVDRLLPKNKHGRARQWHGEPSKKFAAIRHPGTRLVSFYRYYKKNFGVYTNCDFSTFLRDRVDTQEISKRLINPWDDQCEWIMHQDRVIVDVLLRFESLDRDLMCFLFEPDGGQIPKLNQTNAEQQDLLSWYSDKDYRRLRKAFARDFEVLGYS